MKAMDYAGKTCPTSTDQCVYDTDDVGRLHSMLNERCVQATKDRYNPYPTLAAHFV